MLSRRLQRDGCATAGWHFFYGANADTLRRLQAQPKRLAPCAMIAGAHARPIVHCPP
jgi:hypothetical protein